ncbi:MAG: methyltransferase domain-containing protein [archaeon]|nr:MAG: methyltransferase domain-containing protein [archaeon]
MKQGKFSRKIRADDTSYYMSCPEVVARHIASRLADFRTCVELCCGVGMLSIQLARVMNKVFAVDISAKNIEDAKHNAGLYGVAGRIEFITGDVLDEKLLGGLGADVAVLDPDWSGLSENKEDHVSGLEETEPSLRKLFNLTRKHVTENIVARIPKTFSFKTLEEFGPCRMENVFWGDKLRFKIAYFFPEINENSETNISFD